MQLLIISIITQNAIWKLVCDFGNYFHIIILVHIHCFMFLTFGMNVKTSIVVVAVKYPVQKIMEYPFTYSLSVIEDTNMIARKILLTYMAAITKGESSSPLMFTFRIVNANTKATI